MRTLVTVGMALALAATATAQDAPMDEALVGSSQKSVQATPGSGCFFEGDRGGCGDAAYPLPLQGTLFIRRGHAIQVEFDAPVYTLYVSVREPRSDPPGGGGVGRPASLWDFAPVGGSPARTWRATVPPQATPGFMRISLHAGYGTAAKPTGDRDFEAGVQVLRPGRARVRVPRVVGLEYRAAKRQLERRGLRWRVDGGPVEFDTGPPGPQTTEFNPVRRQSIRAGRTVRRGTVVRLVTARSRATASAPASGSGSRRRQSPRRRAMTARR